MSEQADLSRDVLTDAEREFVIGRLLSYARHESKRIINARGKNLNPELLKNLNASMAEAMRIAVKMQEFK